jgi:hypothetical protein
VATAIGRHIQEMLRRVRDALVKLALRSVVPITRPTGILSPSNDNLLGIPIPKRYSLDRWRRRHETYLRN